MSFTNKIKFEILNNKNLNIQKQIYNILLFSNYIFKNNFLFKYVCDSLDNISQKYTITQKNKNYIINTNLNINNNNFTEVISGAFLSCGTISNPENNYHLEFNLHSENLANILINNLNLFYNNSDFDSKIISRKNKYVVYIKEHQKITDLLVLIGAKSCAMDLMQIKMLKEVRNNINRTTNFETANLSKITKSSSEHIILIQKIIDSGKFDNLPENLKEISLLRLNNPYSSISELASMCSEKISKSGVNHRLSKLVNYI